MLGLRLFISFFMVGIAAYGGGVVTIPLIEHEVVIVNNWLSADELSGLIAVAQMTPGPIAVNAATFTGFRVLGFTGAVAATLGVLLPSIIICSVLIYLFARYKHLTWLAVLRKSVQPAVFGLIIAAVITYSNSSITDFITAGLAVATFIILTFFRDRVHPVLMILASGVAGIFLFR